MAEELGKCKVNIVIAAKRTELLNEVAAIINQVGGTAKKGIAINTKAG